MVFSSETVHEKNVPFKYVQKNTSEGQLIGALCKSHF